MRSVHAIAALLAAVSLAVPVSALAVTWTSGGTYYWTPDTGVNQAYVTIVGVGGGGAGGAWSGGGCDGDAGSGGGAGSGGYYSSALVSVTPGTTYTVVVGYGGSPGGHRCGTGAGGTGNNGGDSYIGSVIRAYGGVGGHGGGAPGAGGYPNGGSGQQGYWYCGGGAGGSNPTGWGSGGPGSCGSGNGGWGNDGYVSISPIDSCPISAWQPWGNGVYVIEPGATRKVVDARSFCVTNNSGNYVVIGGGGGDPSGQLASFQSNAGNVGAVVF